MLRGRYYGIIVGLRRRYLEAGAPGGRRINEHHVLGAFCGGLLHCLVQEAMDAVDANEMADQVEAEQQSIRMSA